MQQVLTNLLDNAAKNSAPETPIDLEVTATDREVSIAVTDRDVPGHTRPDRY